MKRNQKKKKKTEIGYRKLKENGHINGKCQSTLFKMCESSIYKLAASVNKRITVEIIRHRVHI